MGMFGPDKKRVTKREMKEVRTHLYNEGFNRREIDEVEKVFRGDMHDQQAINKGIDTVEVEGGIKWMRENKSKHNLSDNRINEIEETLKDKL